MPTLTITPNYESGWAGFSNGSRNDLNALSYIVDESDATYIANWFGTRAVIAFPALSTLLPSGAYPTRLQVYVRGFVTPVLASTSAGNKAQMTSLTVTLMTAGGSAIFANTYDIGSGVGVDMYSQVIGWPVQWTDLATAPQIILDAGTPALLFSDGAIEYAQHITQVRVILTYATQPVVAIISPSTGQVVADTTKPIINWNYTAGADGGPQSRYQIKMYTLAQASAPGFTPYLTVPVWDSGEVFSGGTSAQVGVDLANSTTYKPWIRVAQEINGVPHYSDWRSIDDPGFTISISPTVVPARPIINAIPDPGQARFKITVQQTQAPAWDAVTVERSSDGGVSWMTVRSADQAQVFGQTFVIWDYEAGNGEAVVYRARAHRGNVVSANSPITPSAFWSSPYTWFKSPTHPNLNRIVRFSVSPDETTDIKQGIFNIPGRTTNVVITDIRQAPSLDNLAFLTVSSADRASLQALFDISEPLLLQPPPDFGIDGGYVSCSSVKIRRPARLIREQYRVFETKGTRVSAPAGDIVTSTLTWQDVLDKYQTWQDVIDTFPTWADLLSAQGSALPSSSHVGGGAATDPVITNESGAQITDESGNLISASNTGFSTGATRLLYFTDWSNGAGPWVARTTGTNYAVLNNAKHNYRPAQVTFAPAALSNKGVRIEAVYDAALTAAKADGTSWYYSGLIDCRYTMDFDFSAPLRFTYQWRCVASQGVNPAVALLPTPQAQGSENTIYGAWPRGGQLDLHDAGQGTQKVTGTIYEDDPFLSGTLWSSTVSKTSVDWSQYHTTRVDWLGPAVGVDWYVDNVLIGSVRNLPHQPLPWDNLRYYPIINLAMGGNYVVPTPGNPVHGGATPDTGNFYDVLYFQVEAI